MEEQLVIKKEKNASIQLLRVVCMFFVVAGHIFMNYRVVEGEINYGVLLANSFTGSCVPVFFMLSGMFMFRGKSFKSVIKSTMTKIVLPLICACLLLQLLQPLLIDNKFEFGRVDIPAIFSAFITFSAEPIENGFYLWYVFVLLIVYCWYPLLKLIAVDEKTVNKTRLYLLALGFGGTVLTQTLFAFVPSLYGKFTIPNPLSIYAIFYVLLGYEISRYLSTTSTSKKKIRYMGLGLYVLGAVVTYLLTVFVDIGADGAFNHLFFENDTIGVMLAAVGLVLFFSCIDIKINRYILILKLL